MNFYYEPHFPLLKKVNEVTIGALGDITISNDKLRSNKRAATVWMVDKSRLAQ